MKKYWTVLIVLLLLATFLAACASSATTQPAASQPTASGGGGVAAADGKTLLEQRCTTCHSLERVTREGGNADHWTRTVNQMVQKGANLTAEEQKILVAYLAETYK